MIIHRIDLSLVLPVRSLACVRQATGRPGRSLQRPRRRVTADRFDPRPRGAAGPVRAAAAPRWPRGDRLAVYRPGERRGGGVGETGRIPTTVAWPSRGLSALRLGPGDATVALTSRPIPARTARGDAGPVRTAPRPVGESRGQLRGVTAAPGREGGRERQLPWECDFVRRSAHRGCSCSRALSLSRLSLSLSLSLSLLTRMSRLWGAPAPGRWPGPARARRGVCAEAR